MLTNKDRELQQTTGMVSPDRMKALQHALTNMAADARAAARAIEETDRLSQAAAALRGKAVALGEAARMVDDILRGAALHPRGYSSAKRKAREYGLRRRMRVLGDKGDPE